MPIPQLTYKNNKKFYNTKDNLHNARYNKPKKKSIKTRLFIFGLKLLLLAGIAGTISFLGFVWWFSRDLPSADKLIKRDIALSTKIYDRTGTVVIYDIHGDEKRTMIELKDIPAYAQQATITAEDRQFYAHHGFNLKGMIRALLKNLLHGDLYGQGGSTITQQLVKNAILGQQKTYARKFKELVLSYRIENKYSKDDILKMYLNEIPYGSVVYGIEAASQTFFGKSAKNLTLAEAALIASIPKLPTYYSPYGNNKDKLIARQIYILDAMVEQGYITKDEAEAAKKEELKFKPPKESIIAPHFVMYVKELLAEKYGEKFMEEGGLKVYTTIDLDKQKKAEEAVKNGVEKIKNFKASNGALVAIDPKTGQILAMVGSKDYFDMENDGNFNVALSPRQPGSSFKPLVYLNLLEKEYTTETILFDLVTNFKPKNVKGTDYIPHNYSGKEYGPVTIRKALAGSLNIPAVKALYLAGLDNVLELAKRFGYTTLDDKNRFGLSLVLGGGEVKLLEHTAAYGVLAREGVKHPTAAILKIENKSGDIIEEYKPKEEVVIDAEVVRKMNDILSDDEARSYIFGKGSKLTLQGRPVCAKTGTTNDYKDGWIIGYTPSLVAGVWVGNNDNSEMTRGADGSKVAAPIWNDFMLSVLGKADSQGASPIEGFKKPSPDNPEKIMLNGKYIREIQVKIDKKSGKLANEFCPESLIETKTYNELHSILYYVNKNNPRGQMPEHPENDPQFEEWEAVVKKWAEANKDLKLEKPPLEKCFLHNLENKPIVNITYPNNQETISKEFIEVNIQATAPRGVNRAEYYIDDVLIKTVSSYPFNLSYPSIKIANGFHKLKVKVYDDMDNYNEANLDFNLMIERSSISFEWLAPRNNSSYYASTFPISFTAKISDRFNVQDLKIILQKNNESEPEILKTYNEGELGNDTIEFRWGNNPSTGNYHFYLEVTDKNGRYSKSDDLIINVL